MKSTPVYALPAPIPREAERREPDRQEARGRGRASAGAPRPTPEVVAKATRRRFPADYKQRILAEADTAKATPGAVLGRGQYAAQQALEAMRPVLPFRIQGIDSDNGSEFITAHLVRYCQRHGIQFTRGRPYQQDANAHLEQQNWIHVRTLVGSVRYDAPAAVAALNALSRQALRLFQNLFLPSVTLVRQGTHSRIRRLSDRPQTPFERVQACPAAAPARVAHLPHLQEHLDPFALAEAIDAHLARLYALAHHRAAPLSPARGKQAALPPGAEAASHRPRDTRASRGARPSESQSVSVPPPPSGQRRVTSPMARRSGGK